MGKDEIIQYNRVADAVRYLLSMAWQLSDKSFYRHLKQGKLAGKPWTRDQLDLYAIEFLKPSASAGSAGGTNTKSPVRGAARELIEARKKKIQIETRLKDFDLEEKRGNYMLVSEHSRILLAKLYLVRDAVFNWIRENSGELISVSKGDQIYTDELVALYQESFEKYWSRLDTGAEWPILPEDDFNNEPILK